MGMSTWLKDLQALSDDRRASASTWSEQQRAIRASDDAVARAASFAGRCQEFRSFANSLPEGEDAASGLFSSGLLASRILFLVNQLEQDAQQISQRLEAADLGAHAAILAEFGLASSGTIDKKRLAKSAAAIGQGRSEGLWPSSTPSECQAYALEAARAVERFLLACR